MNFKLYIILFILIFLPSLFSCERHSKTNNSEFNNNTFIIGQWYTSNKYWPHWIMFDSLNNYYRWNFNEHISTKPTAKFILNDSIIHFTYLPLQYPSQLENNKSLDNFILDSISKNLLTILPIDGRIMETYIYERKQFKSPQYADIYLYYLTEKEADSLSSDKSIEQKQLINENLENIFLVLEHSAIKCHLIDSSIIVTRDNSIYNKFEIGGYGIIYFTNDSTYIRRGIPNKTEFVKEINSFFTFIN